MNYFFTLLLLIPTCLFAQVRSPFNTFLIESGWQDSVSTYNVYVNLPFEVRAGQTIYLSLMTSDTLLSYRFTKSQTSPQVQLNFTLHLPSEMAESVSSSINVDSVSVPGNTFTITSSGDSDTLRLSGLLSYLVKSTSSGLVIFPANNFFALSDTFYFQFYTSLIPVTNFDKFMYRFSLVSSFGDTVATFLKQIKGKNQQLHSGYLALNESPAGRYQYHINLFRNNQLVISRSSNEFYLINPEKPQPVWQTANNKTTGFFDNYSNEELDELFTMSAFIASAQELELYPKLKSVLEKRQFMNSFWERRENHPESPVFLNDYLDDVRRVQKLYGIPGKPGYLTDRGRVMLKYGACDDLYESSMEVDTKPYEVWYYQNLVGQGSVYFYFVDMNGFGDFRLIHSTARDEVYNLSSLRQLGIDPDNFRNLSN